MELFASQLIEKLGLPEASSVLLQANTLKISVPASTDSLIQEKLNALITYTGSLGDDVDLEIWVGSARLCLLNGYSIGLYLSCKDGKQSYGKTNHHTKLINVQ